MRHHMNELFHHVLLKTFDTVAPDIGEGGHTPPSVSPENNLRSLAQRFHKA